MLRSKIGVNGNLHSRLRNDVKEATLNYRLIRKMAGGGMCTHALRPKTTVLPGSIVMALLELDIRKNTEKATFGARHGWVWSSHSHW